MQIVRTHGRDDVRKQPIVALRKLVPTVQRYCREPWSRIPGCSAAGHPVIHTLPEHAREVDEPITMPHIVGRGTKETI